MAHKTGGGAATAAGIGYQDRVAGYFIAHVLLDHTSDKTFHEKLSEINFEVSLDVDDLNLVMVSGRHLNIQIKRALSFSLTEESDLTKTLTQFVKQFSRNKTANAEFALIASTDSSRKISQDMRIALEAIRSGSEENFRRDQSSSLIQVLDSLIEKINDISEANSLGLSHEDIINLLRKTYVMPLNIIEGGDLEQAIILLLKNANFSSPPLLWGKILSDCTDYSSKRRSLTSEYIREKYSCFKNETTEQEDTIDNSEFFDVVLPEYNFSVGREVVLCEPHDDWLDEGYTKENTVFLIEFYRFDEECNERIQFFDGKCRLGDGSEANVISRQATYAGMERFIENNRDLIGDKELRIIPNNSEEDFDANECAKKYKARIKNALDKNAHPSKCIHCGEGIDSNDCLIAERHFDGELEVGLLHPYCLKPDDRIMGTIQSELFEQYASLKGFDAGKWFENIERGQGAFINEKIFREQSMMLWAGPEDQGPHQTYTAEFLLDDGTSEFAFKRGKLQLITRAKGEVITTTFNEKIKKQLDLGDPLCMSDQSIAFGPYNMLTQQIGASENLREITEVRLKKVTPDISKHHDEWKNWYAPLMYFWLPGVDELLSISGHVILLTQPLKLDRFLKNWEKIGLELPEYELKIISDDKEFDHFAEAVFRLTDILLIDPLFKAGDEPELLSGIVMRDQREVEMEHQNNQSS
ncbi:hypothetical protein RYZ26_15980 [Terasakiella sp. A23]|uniref:hypothetical protein n=1 Tax=Terasakiella sp. FCG-A23 TaxID=3080561 RepID=UPI0029551FE5|nr:hypothetical protein [Terasakiella sp. A23]MDV7341107.1 hypothetical protein [Terasakiella sp. A23]